MAPSPTHRRSASRSERRLAAVQRRRQLATARSAAARRAVRRKRRLRAVSVFAVLAVAAAVITAVALWPEEEPSTELRAQRVPGAVGPLAIATVPTSYRAVYKAETYEGSTATVSTEEIAVVRPFDGRVFIREGEPPGSTVRFEGRSTFGVYANYTESGAAQVAGDAPTVALGDLRLVNSLADLVQQGLFELRERRRALGRECQVYRTGSPLQSLKITAPTDSDYVDACLDDAGLLLEEVAVVGGKLAQRLTATQLEYDVALDPADFAIQGDRLPSEQGGAEVTEVDRTAAPTAGYWALDTVPVGFTHRGRYLVVREGSTYVDVYVRDTELVTVRQGAPAAEPDLGDAPPGRDVDLGALGSGRIMLGSIGATVVAHPGSDGFVHVAGTLAPTELQAIASGLRRS